MKTKLTSKFFIQNTCLVAQKLLGKFLIRKIGKKILSGMIVETEAYRGFNDDASHASRGKTDRTKVMFDKPGTVYVYLIYGMYYCLNIVTEKKNFPAAVLIRAIEPKEGIKEMYKNRGFKYPSSVAIDLTNGPGKLCQAMKIEKDLNGLDVFGSKIWIENKGVKVFKKDIVRTKRIGVDYASKSRDYLWRFYIKGNKFISKE